MYKLRLVLTDVSNTQAYGEYRDGDKIFTLLMLAGTWKTIVVEPRLLDISKRVCVCV